MANNSRCASCGIRKGIRPCPVKGAPVCTLCCGSKRGRELDCPPSCPHFTGHRDYQARRETERLIGQAFPDEAHDVFKRPEAALFSAALEKYFVDNFLGQNVRDEQIYEALAKIHARRTGRGAGGAPSGGLEEEISRLVEITDQQQAQTPPEVKNLVLLRIMLAIKRVSGGAFGPCGYLNMIANMLGGDAGREGAGWPGADPAWDLEVEEDNGEQGAD